MTTLCVVDYRIHKSKSRRLPHDSSEMRAQGQHDVQNILINVPEDGFNDVPNMSTIP
jgi:hypothetical protein